MPGFRAWNDPSHSRQGHYPVPGAVGLVKAEKIQFP
jgi:hypothetical protein